VGLRERKRLETRQRLERAALEIVIDQGLNQLTVDAISERADVSRRTFFNYFDSKEDAILGLPTQDDMQRSIAEVLDDIHPRSLLDGVLSLLIAIGPSAARDPELSERRRRIIGEHPELLHRQFSQMNRAMGPLSEAVQTLMARVADAPARGSCTDAQAQVVLMMCGAALRSTIAQLARTHSGAPTDQTNKLLRDKAAALVRDAIGKLA